MSFDCTNCNCTDLKMRKMCFLFVTFIYLQFIFTHCLHMKKSIKIEKDLLVKYTHRKANGKKLRSSSKKSG